ncbi:hypothetical protein ACERK3_04455 [Phycisphaerales bacterium AB-hyl4]|uniref:Uncharacterized protein n=1 Tax=Natronomicrosphaera hydrolytica TaxID=3242702 RepID=A0ABV4U1Q5_9BACT
MAVDGVMVRRRQTAVWLGKLLGRRYVLAWGLCVAGASLHAGLTPGAEGVAWQGWASGVVAMTAVLLAVWWAEPYVAYRYRRRRFRRVLAAEGGWQAWSLHLPARPWSPTRGRRRGARRRRTASAGVRQLRQQAAGEASADGPMGRLRPVR